LLICATSNLRNRSSVAPKVLLAVLAGLGVLVTLETEVMMRFLY
jgi:hypothetical protein